MARSAGRDGGDVDRDGDIAGSRARHDPAVGPAVPTVREDLSRPAYRQLLTLQRSVGNSAVSARYGQSSLLVQRDEDDSFDPQGGDSPVSDGDNVSVTPPPPARFALTGIQDQRYALADLRAMDPSFLPGMPQEAPGDQLDDPITAMAVPLDRAVQRQSAPTGLPDTSATPTGAGSDAADDAPHLSTDLGAGYSAGATYPWALTTTVVYRNLNYRTFPNVLRGLDILHEPQATFMFSTAPQALLSAQLAVGLVNLHLPSLFGTELEAQLLAQVQYDSTQGTSAGGGIQLEQHIWKGISATFNLSGMWTLPAPGTPASFSIAPGGGLTVHTDAF